MIDVRLCYDFMDRHHLEELHVAGREAGIRLIDLAVWNQMSGLNGTFYKSQLENCIIFKHGMAPRLNNIEPSKNGRNRLTVWNFTALLHSATGVMEI